jgi:hypothetical protein
MSLGNYFTWFGIYLAIGAVTLVSVRSIVLWVQQPKPVSAWVREVYQLMKKPQVERSFWATHREMLIFLPWIWLCWPLSVAIGVKLALFPSEWKPDPQAAFTCKRKHLVREVTPGAAEKDATVFDPLGRVPDLPFGHLHAGWCALLANRQKRDKLWYFEVPGDAARDDGTQWPVPQGAKQGYALVRKGKVQAEFVFEWD